jgi:hypothetical protein
MSVENKITLISEFIETKLRKEQELEFYQKQLEELQSKMGYLRKDIDITNVIIDLIKSEKILDIEDYMLEKNETLLIGKNKK